MEYSGSFYVDRKLDDETLKLLEDIITKSNANDNNEEPKRYKFSNGTVTLLPTAWSCPLKYNNTHTTIEVINKDKETEGDEVGKWIIYFIKNIFKPRRYILNGSIGWRNIIEDNDDGFDNTCQENDIIGGKIEVHDNIVSMFALKVVYEQVFNW